MVISEDINALHEGLDGLSSNYKLVYNSLTRLKGENVNKVCNYAIFDVLYELLIYC